MDFDALPDNVCKQILQRLPLKQQVRIARVNRRFKNLSNMIISFTTKISFSEEFDGITMTSLSKLLKVCATSLEEAAFHGFFGRLSGSRNMASRWVEEFSKVQFPRLVTVKISSVDIEGTTLRELLINCPQMRRLHIRCCEVRGELPIAVCNELQSVGLKTLCPVGIFEAIVECCPNLKKLAINVCADTNANANANNANRWKQALNRAFSERRGLEAMDVETLQELGEVENLFLLHSLRFLRLFGGSIFSNHMITSISTHLSQLEHLELWGQFESWQGIAALHQLKKLRRLDLHPTSVIHQALDPGMRLLASSQSLEQVKVYNLWLAKETVYAFARQCTRLQRFTMLEKGVHGIVSVAQAEDFVAGLKCFVQQNLTIHLENITDRMLWSSGSVQKKVAEVNGAAGGRQISLAVQTTGSDSSSAASEDDEQ